ncbi:hypothetical protein TYRP_023491, partial [Tyrophagus putrescentiae]
PQTKASIVERAWNNEVDFNNSSVGAEDWSGTVRSAGRGAHVVSSLRYLSGTPQEAKLWSSFRECRSSLQTV